MMETDFKARGEASGVRGSKGPPTRPTRAGGLAGRQGGKLSGKPRRLVSLKGFYEGIMGMSRGWYNKHKHDPGFPQPVYVGKEPRLILDECLVYQARFIEARDRRQ